MGPEDLKLDNTQLFDDDDDVQEIPPDQLTYTDPDAGTGAAVDTSIGPYAAMGQSQPQRSPGTLPDVSYSYYPPKNVAMSTLASSKYTYRVDDSHIAQNKMFTELDSCNSVWNGPVTDSLFEPAWKGLAAEHRAEEEAAAAAKAAAQVEAKAAEWEAYLRGEQRASSNPGHMDPRFPDSNLDSMGAPPFHPSRATHAAQMTTDPRLRQPTTSTDMRPFAEPGRTSGLPQSETPRVAGGRKTLGEGAQRSRHKEEKNGTKTSTFGKRAAKWYKRSMYL